MEVKNSKLKLKLKRKRLIHYQSVFSSYTEASIYSLLLTEKG